LGFWHNFKRKIPADAFSLCGFLAAAFIMLLATFRSAMDVRTATAWEAFIYEAMLLYLIFVSLRTAILVMLSFSDRFFRNRHEDIKHFPLVSVIVPCYNEEVVVKKAVESILKLDYPNFEVVIVDDGSTDLTLMFARELLVKARVRVIHQKNGGKAAALNRGISEAYGEFVLNVDADSMLDPLVIRYGLPYYERDPDLAAVAGSVRVGNTHNTLTLFQKLEYVVGLNFHKSAQSFMKCVTIVPGPVGLFRKKLIQEVGGYQHNTYAEDCDLSLRLLMAGYNTVYCNRMVAVTEAPDDYDSLLKQRYRWSRGILQAVKVNSRWLWRPWKNWRNFCILFYTLIETMFIPSVNFLFAIVFVQQAITSQYLFTLGPYFLQLTVLDVVLSTYSVIYEKQAARLILLAMVNRLTYGLSMEVLRFCSILDEMAGLPMNWNKLQRKGL
jgi:biofilm PGA synthesis N-glycosyltransferase PgaC